MSGATCKESFQPDSDVHILYDDQQKINKFARLNAKLKDTKVDIMEKENDLKCLEEAHDELCLFDDNEKIPYLVGEVFIFKDTTTAQKCLDGAKLEVEKEIQTLKRISDELQDLMNDLKIHLYGKFGNRINLEADEESI